MDIWTAVRFVHVLRAVVWVGGLLTITVVLLPAAYRVLAAPTEPICCAASADGSRSLPPQSRTGHQR